MSATVTPTTERSGSGLGADFLKLFAGEIISTLGSSFSGFAIPLLIFQLTHSAINLALTTVTFSLPRLFFGLLIGVWVDRVDRKRLMIAANVLLAATVGTIPMLAAIHRLSVAWIYLVGFIASSLTVVFDQAEGTAIPNIVDRDHLVKANGRLNAGFESAYIAGPLLAGLIATVLPVSALLAVDAVSYIASAVALSLVAARFNQSGDPEAPGSIRGQMLEGVRYVLGQPVLRNISLLMMLFNFVIGATTAQDVFFAKVRLHVTNGGLGLFFAAAAVGALIFSLLAERLNERLSFSRLVLGSLMAMGLALTTMAAMPWLWAALPFWLLFNGLGAVVNISALSLRQAIVPDQLLGRVLSVSGVLAVSVLPIGALLGGIVIQSTQNVALVFGCAGILLFLIPVAFIPSSLGHSDRYLPQKSLGTPG